MHRLAVLLICALALAACGSEEPREAPWLPSFDTPELASETYARALESGNLDLAILCVAPQDRQEVGSRLAHFLRFAERGNARFEIEFKDPMLSETEALCEVIYYFVNTDGVRSRVINRGGEPVELPKVKFLLVRQPDGTWRLNRTHLVELFPPAQDEAEDSEPQESEPEAPPVTDE